MFPSMLQILLLHKFFIYELNLNHFVSVTRNKRTIRWYWLTNVAAFLRHLNLKTTTTMQVTVEVFIFNTPWYLIKDRTLFPCSWFNGSREKKVSVKSNWGEKQNMFGQISDCFLFLVLIYWFVYYSHYKTPCIRIWTVFMIDFRGSQDRFMNWPWS